MLEINVKEARSQLSLLLDRVQSGEEVLITRRGRRVARLVPAADHVKLSSLSTFRAALQIGGAAMSETVVRLREEERY